MLIRPDGSSATLSNTLGILHKCRKKKNLEYAKHMHANICENGIDHRTSGNYVVPMFVECGSMSDAQQVFNCLLDRNEHSWTSLLSGYIITGQLQNAIRIYPKMQEDRFHPTCYTLTALLKACTKLKDIEKGRQIHIDAKENGFDKDLSVGSALIAMYAKCGSLAEAQNVFDNLSVRDVVCWTTLLAGYVENDFGQKALSCFDQMQQEGIFPDVVTLVCCLKACVSIGAIDKGQKIHIEVAKRGLEGNPFVGTTLVDLYAKHGSIVKAQEVFDKLPVRNVISWNALIAGYEDNGLGSQALKRFEEMQQEDVLPNATTFGSILKACTSTIAINMGREIHCKIIQQGFGKDCTIGSALVGMYAKCGFLTEAEEVFDKLSVQDIVSWNVLIAGYAENGHGEKVLKCFRQIQLDGVSPNTPTFICILKSSGNVGAIDMIKEIHADLLCKTVAQETDAQDIYVGNTLIDSYAKCNLLADAREVFDKMPVHDVVSWTALISGYLESGFFQEALSYFEHMTLEGIDPNSATFVCCLKACSQMGAIDKGRQIHMVVTEKGYQTDPFVGNVLIDMYAKCNSLGEAREVFNNLLFRDIISWTALIAGYAENGCSLEALECFEQMQLDGISPDIVTFVCSLKACSSIGAIDKGRKIHIKMEEDLEGDLLVGTTLIDMYAKGGSLLEAEKAFHKLPLQNVISWNAMIRGYGVNDEGNMAIKCFEDMRKQNVRPDATTFICLLTACGRANLVSKCKEYFKQMATEYGITATSDHYICLVDHLARSGNLHEALKLLESVSYPLPKGTWTSLLNACRTYGEVELGLKCFQHLIQLDLEGAIPYVLMANLYASAGMLDHANRIEELRKNAGAKKSPAKAVIEVNGNVHLFSVGSEKSWEISAMLQVLSSRLKSEGYVPNIELVLGSASADEKEMALCGHAERLAIAFGLLHTPQGQALRVTKNLRMCTDCHNVSKIISRTEGREITIREGNWVHQFKDGLCSCGDMW